jgi:hypothetical protein
MAAGQSGSNGAHTQGHRSQSQKHKASDLDSVVKDAKNLMNELNKAPPLSSLEATQAQANGMLGKEQGAFDAAVDILTADQAAVTPSRRSRANRRIKSQVGAAASYHSQSNGSAGGHGHRGGGTPRSARGTRSTRSGRSNPAYENTPLPRSILEQPIADPARDAYYGGGTTDDDAGITLSRAKKPAAQVSTDGPRSLSRRRGTPVRAFRGSNSLRANGPCSMTSVGAPHSRCDGHMSPSHAHALAHARSQAELANGRDVLM